MKDKRIVITGMGIISPIGDNLEDFYNNLIAGKSGITKLKTIDTSQILSKIGGDMGDYDFKAKLESYKGLVPDDVIKKARKISKTAPFSTKITILAAIDAYQDAGLFKHDVDKNAFSAILGGHNFHSNYIEKNVLQFLEEPDYIDGFFGISMFDTDTIACIAETLEILGPMSTVGGACASAGLALRNTVNEIKYNGCNIGIVGGGVLEFSRVGTHALEMMQAISHNKFNDAPEKASRPYDVLREGFVPSHGSGMLIVEDLEHAEKRGANIYAEVLGVEANNDGSHLSLPSVKGQTYVLNKILNSTKISPEKIDYINAHATSTPLGDKIEIESIKNVFGRYAKKLKINATKSMIGHTGWTAHSVELIASVLQMNNSKLHPSINIDEIDPEVDLDVCANESKDCEINYLINNSFGFGGINCCSLIKKITA